MTAQAVMPAAKKATITPRAALLSHLRIWLLARDEALWAFCSGTEADDPLEEIKVDEQVTMHVAEANEARKKALKIAEQIARENEQKASSVMRDAISELLASETPKFLLALPHIPGSF